MQFTLDGGQRKVTAIEEADGLWFVCPKCFVEKGGRAGAHGVVCWNPNVPQEIRPNPGRWTMTGTGLHDVTLSPSVHLSGPGCRWHGWIRKGEALLG